MLFKRTTLYVTFILLLTQTPSMHSITIFGYNFDVTPRVWALYSSMQNYIWNPWSSPIHKERNTSGGMPALVQSTTSNFSQLCDNFIGWCTIKTILSLYPDTAQAFVQPAVNNFSRMCNSRYGYDILQTILQCYPNAAQAFVRPAIDNFSQVCNNRNGCYTLSIILRHCPDAAQGFIQPVIDNFFQTCNHRYGVYILAEIFEYYPDAAQAFAKHMVSDPRFFYPFNDLVEHKTQTKQHLRTNLSYTYQRLSSQGSINYQDYPDLQTMTKQVIDREYSEQQKGRYTFVHGHAWYSHCYQELYTDLWSIMHEQPNNYRFMRYKYPSRPSIEAFFAYIEQEQEKRKKLLGSGVNIDTDYISDKLQDRLLFMNYALFVNSQGSNTGYYIKANKSYTPKDIDCSLLIKELQLDQYLTQDELEYLENQFIELQDEHISASKYGGGLLLSFMPELMAQCVYPCHGGGRKRTVEIEGLGEIYDPKVILDTLRTTPEKIIDSDRMEFVCVLSHDSTLIPNNGLDIYEFNAADQDELAAWRAKKNELMAWIKERVNKRRQALAAQAATQKMRARL